MERIEVLGTLVDNLSMQETVEAVEKYVQEKKFLHLMGVNADKINTLQKDKRLKDIVNSCGIINADGVSVVWASKKLKKPLKERVAGIDLMLELLKRAEKKGYSVYLLGAKQRVVEGTVRAIQSAHPALKIAGYHNGYFKSEEWPQIAELVKKSKADFVFVGITSPVKEYLIEYFEEQKMNSVFMGVGGSFDVISGEIPRAPKWMQNIGMEWLFRVAQEPGRLWKRYFIGNIQFIVNVYREKYGKRD
ncbi:MAG: WecB/TagA/CpsF family glycosyltransferase [Lachnospiraceae bacterium]